MRSLPILLTFCLAMEPIMAASHHPYRSLERHKSPHTFFKSEAFSVKAVWERLPFSSVGVRSSRQQGSSVWRHTLVEQDFLFAGRSDGRRPDRDEVMTLSRFEHMLGELLETMNKDVRNYQTSLTTAELYLNYRILYDDISFFIRLFNRHAQFPEDEYW